jgi:hypothetical protein
MLLTEEATSMPINPAALERVKGAKLRPEKVAAILEQLAAVLDVTGAGQTQLNLDYQDPKNSVESGDLIPYITIGLRPATEDKS